MSTTHAPHVPRVPLALALLLTPLACDQADSPESESALQEPLVEFRGRGDGECLSIGVTPVSGSYRTSGTPNPFPEARTGDTFVEINPEWQIAFDEALVEQTAYMLEAIYLSREDAPEHCTAACLEEELGWTGRACAFDVDMARTEPQPRSTSYDGLISWETDVEAVGSVACDCA